MPGDPGQVIYVWFDALAKYITALGYGTGDAAHWDWWRGAGERLHVIGKGITRFHAVYWPAILRSAGEPVPTAIRVHDYLTVDGGKISKSLGGSAGPVAVVERFGADALRWWFVRDVPRNGDADFREELVGARANELADGLGNLVNRTIALVSAQPDAAGPPILPHPGAVELRRRADALPAAVDRALAEFDLRAASSALWGLVVEANRFVSATRPWELARAARAGDLEAAAELRPILAALVESCELIARELRPFLPGAADRIDTALGELDAERGRMLFRKVP